jgi:pimeloyl-ACP methyl ester carboxylesterase
MSPINKRIAGTEEPTLIFVHGFACALGDWDKQLEALSPSFRCVAIDLPGHGASEKPTRVSIEAMGEAVNRVKELIGARRTVLIGHSMGCRVIAEACQQSQSALAGLVFVDGSILGHGDPKASVKRVKDAIDDVGMGTFTRRLFSDMFLEGSEPALREQLIARAQKVDASFREELFLDMIRWDAGKARDVLKQIMVSALVLQSTYVNANLKRVALQAVTTTPWMQAVKSLIPKSEARIIPGAGHFTMIEAAQTVNDEIRAFAARVN